jgi:hypothetical protein
MLMIDNVNFRDGLIMMLIMSVHAR